MSGAEYTTRHLTENWRVQIPIQKSDWKDPAQYEYVTELNDRELAWEFLRRNPDYIEGFKRWSALMQCREVREADVLCDTLCEQFRLSKTIGLLNPYLNALEQGQLGFAPTIFDGDDLPTQELLRYWIDGEEVSFMDDIPPLSSRLCMEVRIVAERPLEEQLDAIRDYYEWMHRRGDRPLKSEKPKTVRNRPQEFKNYLRILDAKIEGVLNADIAGVMYPGEVRKPAQDKISKQLKKANEWMSSGYLKLVPTDVSD